MKKTDYPISFNTAIAALRPLIPIVLRAAVVLEPAPPHRQVVAEDADGHGVGPDGAVHHLLVLEPAIHGQVLDFNAVGVAVEHRAVDLPGPVLDDPGHLVSGAANLPVRLNLGVLPPWV